MNRSLGDRVRFRWLHWLPLAAFVLAAPVHAEPAMWVIKDKDSTIYLIGTVHLLKPDMVWNSEKVMKALGESKELWLEVTGMQNPASILPLIQKYGIDQAKPLSEKIGPELQEKLTAVAKQYGMPPQALEPMRPWLAAMTVVVLPLQKAGFDPNKGVEAILTAQAEKEGDAIKAFETAEEQVRLLAEMPEKEQLLLLEQSLEDASQGMALFEKILAAWAAGDTETLNQIIAQEMKEEAPALYKSMLVDRNVRWAEQIETMLKGSGIQQIAVGAGHLVGPDSVQAQLEKRGIKAERF